MEKQRIEKMFAEIEEQIKQNGWKKSTIPFEKSAIMQRDYVDVDEQYNSVILQKEYNFFANQWEVSLDYSINETSGLVGRLRKFIRKIRKKILERYTLQQNALNFSNLEFMHQVLLYTTKYQRENAEIRKKCENLEKRITELESLKKNNILLNEGMNSD